MNEHRRETRVPITLKIKFKSVTVDDFIERYAVDVSRGGVFIRTRHQQFEVGTPLRFEFQLQDLQPIIVGEGTVVWTRSHDPGQPAPSGRPAGLGVRFDQLSGASGFVLDRILAEKQRRGERPEESRYEVGLREAGAGGPSERTPLPSPLPGLATSADFGSADTTRVMGSAQARALVEQSRDDSWPFGEVAAAPAGASAASPPSQPAPSRPSALDPATRFEGDAPLAAPATADRDPTADPEMGDPFAGLVEELEREESQSSIRPVMPAGAASERSDAAPGPALAAASDPRPSLPPSPPSLALPAWAAPVLPSLPPHPPAGATEERAPPPPPSLRARFPTVAALEDGGAGPAPAAVPAAPGPAPAGPPTEGTTGPAGDGQAALTVSDADVESFTEVTEAEALHLGALEAPLAASAPPPPPPPRRDRAGEDDGAHAEGASPVAVGSLGQEPLAARGPAAPAGGAPGAREEWALVEPGRLEDTAVDALAQGAGDAASTTDGGSASDVEAIARLVAQAMTEVGQHQAGSAARSEPAPGFGAGGPPSLPTFRGMSGAAADDLPSGDAGGAGGRGAAVINDLMPRRSSPPRPPSMPPSPPPASSRGEGAVVGKLARLVPVTQEHVMNRLAQVAQARSSAMVQARSSSGESLAPAPPGSTPGAGREAGSEATVLVEGEAGAAELPLTQQATAILESHAAIAGPAALASQATALLSEDPALATRATVPAGPIGAPPSQAAQGLEATQAGQGVATGPGTAPSLPPPAPASARWEPPAGPGGAARLDREQETTLPATASVAPRPRPRAPGTPHFPWVGAAIALVLLGAGAYGVGNLIAPWVPTAPAAPVTAAPAQAGQR